MNKILAMFALGLVLGVLLGVVFTTLYSTSQEQDRCEYGGATLGSNGTPAPWCDYDSNGGWYFNECVWRGCYV